MKENSSFARHIMLFQVLVLNAYSLAIAADNSTQSTIDTIISNFNEHRGRLNTYRTNYTVTSQRKPNHYYKGPDAAVKRVTNGSYLMDRGNNRFKFESENTYAWYRSQKKWVPLPYKAANDGQKHIVFKGISEDNPQNRPSATVSDKKTMSQIGSNPRSYFSNIGGVDFGEFLESIKGEVSKVVRLADFKYKIIHELPADEERKREAGYRVEYIVDPQYDWNLISERAYDPSGKKIREKVVEYVTIDSIPFVRTGSHIYYSDKESDEPTNAIHLITDVNSVEINPVVSNEDFQIDLPIGTRVYDKLHDLTFEVGGEDSIMDSALDDPAIIFASGKELEDIIGEDTKPVDTSLGKNEERQTTDIPLKPADSTKYPDTRLLLVICLIAAVILATIYKTLRAIGRRKDK
ncbi:MAG: hypothetical protein ACYS32_02730 [Planctomycetota bacterium]|jgi:hypothetical protein